MPNEAATGLEEPLLSVLWYRGYSHQSYRSRDVSEHFLNRPTELHVGAVRRPRPRSKHGESDGAGRLLTRAAAGARPRGARLRTPPTPGARCGPRTGGRRAAGPPGGPQAGT